MDEYSRKLKENQKDKASKQEKNQKALSAEQKKENPANPKKDAMALQKENLTPEEIEQQQAQQQWLRKIPDDPGGLLRRKFRYQYQKQADQVQLREQVKQAW